MYLDILQSLNLSMNEARIYEALVFLGEGNASQIAVASKVNRRNIYDCMNRLMDKQLVFVEYRRHEAIYTPAHPDKLVELVDTQADLMKQQVDAFKKIFPGKKGITGSYIYKGKEGFKNYMRDILRSGEDGYYLGAKAGWLDPDFRSYFDHFLEQSNRMGLKHYHLFDHQVKEKHHDVIEIFKDHPIKFLPKEFDTDCAVDVFGDHVVTFTGIHLGQVENDITLYVLVDRAMAESYKTWFRFIWDHLGEA